jgi:Rieske Fe-S protein
VAAGAAVALGDAGCGAQGRDQPTGPIAAGNVSDLPAGSFRVMGDLVLARDDGGIYAMSAICTHQGCPTQANSAGGLSCPCHGARFDHDGNVLAGPARSPLPHFAVELAADGAITVQASDLVSMDARMKIG